MNAFVASLPGFSGTPQLLLYLVREEELKIRDLSLTELIEQFTNYIKLLEQVSLDEAGEFIVIASLLIRLKVIQLLPVAPEESQEEAESSEFLIHLEEYKKFKEVAATLKEKEEERRLLFGRGFVPEELEENESELADATLFDLLEALRHILPELSSREPMEVAGEEVTIEERMEFILKRLREDTRIDFASILETGLGRSHVVVTFVALLELIRLGLVRARQRSVFSHITIVAGRRSAGSNESQGRAS